MMKGLLRDLIFACVAGVIVPWLWISGIREQQPAEQPVQEMQTLAAQGPEVRILETSGMITAMDIEEYTLGVVLGEMPAGFGIEALKAQAVAGRTIAAASFLSTGKHAEADICCRAECCQAFLSPEQFLELGGTQEELQKVQAAVITTAGEILTYEETVIEATYFSSSGGRTERAEDVWGQDVPYLQSVESPEKEEESEYKIFVPRENLERIFSCRLEGTPENWFANVCYTQGGGVDTAEIGGEIYSGTELRAGLDLPSTAFSIEPGEGGLMFLGTGHGHRVGMSQYGANAMSSQGKGYAEILAWYYPGCSISRLGG